MKPFLIMNPMSRNGRSGKLFGKVISLVESYGLDYEKETTLSLNHAYELSKKANMEKYDPVIAVGGDGTINAVLNGFFDKEGKRISASGMGVIYTGTSPDFCMNYNIPLDIEEAIKVILNGRKRSIRVGKLSYCAENISKYPEKNFQGADCNLTRYFGCCANIGIGASIARYSNMGIRKYLGDKPGTFISLIRALLNYRHFNLKLTVDGETIVLSRVYNISVGRSRYIASGIKVNHNLEDTDEVFYILITKDLHLSVLPGVIRQIYSSRPIRDNQQLQLLFGSRVEINSTGSEQEVEFDGDPAGYTPCSVELAADPLDLMVSR